MSDAQFLKEATSPDGFESTSKGIYKITKTNNGEGRKTFISGPIAVICHLYDSATELWALKVGFNTHSGNYREMTITMKSLHGTNRALVQKLAFFGLHIIPGKGKDLKRYLGSFEANDIQEWYPVISADIERAMRELCDFILMNSEHFADPKEKCEGGEVGYYNGTKGLYLLTGEVLQEVIEDISLDDFCRELRRRNLLFRNENDRNLSKHTVEGKGRSSFYAIREAILSDASI